MERHAFALKVLRGKMGQFRSNLGLIWPKLTVFLDEHQMTNFSIWSAENLIFGYYETGEGFSFSEEDKKVVAEWERLYGDAYEWISKPFEDMRLMYHDFGIIRENKELIRHRVFITKLVPGTEEEYKARHDALVETMGNKIT